MTAPSGRAVVLGGGIAGLLTARVLADAYGQVTVVERDPLPDRAEPRRGVPQGRQINGLESRGVQVMEELLPGLTAELTAAGAGLIDDLDQMLYRVDDIRMTRRPTPIHPFLLVTRPFLEGVVRRRVSELAPVSIRDRLEVTGLLHRPGPDGTTVCGVRVTASGGGAPEEIEADLVVDATGRGSRTPVWLGELGYPRPSEDRIPVGVSYASWTLPGQNREPADSRLWPPFVIEGTVKPGQVGISLFRCEQGRIVFSVNGPREAFPTPVSAAWMLQVAQARLPEQALDAVRAACGSDTGGGAAPISVHQVPVSVWRRYDRLARFPEGLLVLGDALCAFNPVYGQGTSVAAGQALALRASLAGGSHDLAARFFASAAPPTAAAWRLTSGPDLARIGGALGRERLAAWMTEKLLSQAFRAAAGNGEVARVLTGVTGLSESRSALLRPRVLVPVVASASALALRRVVALGRRKGPKLRGLRGGFATLDR